MGVVRIAKVRLIAHKGMRAEGESEEREAEHMIQHHFASLNVAKLNECRKGCKMASKRSCGTKRKQDKQSIQQER